MKTVKSLSCPSPMTGRGAGVWKVKRCEWRYSRRMALRSGEMAALKRKRDGHDRAEGGEVSIKKARFT